MPYFVDMNPLRTNAEHELRFFRESPRLLEQKVGIPFRRVTGEKRRNSRLKFQPVLYRRNFNRDGGAEARSAVFDIPVSAPQAPRLRQAPCRPTARRRFQRRETKMLSRQVSPRSWISPHLATTCIIERKTATMRGSERPCRDGRHAKLTHSQDMRPVAGLDDVHTLQ